MVCVTSLDSSAPDKFAYIGIGETEEKRHSALFAHQKGDYLIIELFNRDALAEKSPSEFAGNSRQCGYDALDTGSVPSFTIDIANGNIFHRDPASAKTQLIAVENLDGSFVAECFVIGTDIKIVSAHRSRSNPSISHWDRINYLCRKVMRPLVRS